MEGEIEGFPDELYELFHFARLSGEMRTLLVMIHRLGLLISTIISDR